MPKIAKTVCGRGHEKPLDSDCSVCSRDRALARYAAKRDEINAAKRARSTRQKRPPKPYDKDGNLLCSRALHVRIEGQACQECRRDHYAKMDRCRRGHDREGPGACRECQRAAVRRWKDAHRDEQNAKALENYYVRKAAGLVEKSTEKVREWKRKNPEKLGVLVSRENARRRRVLHDAFGSHTESEWQAVIARQKGRCAACATTKRKLTKDHIVPLSEGGSDMILNIQALCQPCNSRKGARLALETQRTIFDRIAATV